MELRGWAYTRIQRDALPVRFLYFLHCNWRGANLCSVSLPHIPGHAEEAIANGVTVAVCSTSNERAVSNIVRVMLGDAIAERMRVFAGDVVPKKKPAPDIYLLAAKV